MTQDDYNEKLKELNERMNAYAEKKINAAYQDGLKAGQSKTTWSSKKATCISLGVFLVQVLIYFLFCR